MIKNKHLKILNCTRLSIEFFYYLNTYSLFIKFSFKNLLSLGENLFTIFVSAFILKKPIETGTSFIIYFFILQNYKICYFF